MSQWRQLNSIDIKSLELYTEMMRDRYGRK